MNRVLAQTLGQGSLVHILNYLYLTTVALNLMYRPFDIVMIIICGVSLLIMIPLLFYILWILLKDWLRHRKHAKNSGAKGTMDPDPSLLAGASILYLATRSSSRSRKTEPRHDWIEEEESLDYAALDEDFKDEVNEFFDREDYDF